MFLDVLVDDRRTFIDGRNCELFKTPDKAVSFLENIWEKGDSVGTLWLDHDLGLDANGDSITIWPVVDWLCLKAFENQPLKVERIIVHSANPVGRQNIIAALTTQRFEGIYNVLDGASQTELIDDDSPW